MQAQRGLDGVRLEPRVDRELRALQVRHGAVGPHAQARVPEQHRTQVQRPDVVPRHGRAGARQDLPGQKQCELYACARADRSDRDGGGGKRAEGTAGGEGDGTYVVVVLDGQIREVDLRARGRVRVVAGGEHDA